MKKFFIMMLILIFVISNAFAQQNIDDVLTDENGFPVVESISFITLATLITLAITIPVVKWAQSDEDTSGRDDETIPIPEPVVLGLFGTGLVGLFFSKRKLYEEKNQL